MKDSVMVFLNRQHVQERSNVGQQHHDKSDIYSLLFMSYVITFSRGLFPPARDSLVPNFVKLLRLNPINEVK